MENDFSPKRLIWPIEVFDLHKRKKIVSGRSFFRSQKDGKYYKFIKTDFTYGAMGVWLITASNEEVFFDSYRFRDLRLETVETFDKFTEYD